MNLFAWFRKSKPAVQPQQQRGYTAGDMSRLTSDWIATGNNADAEIRGGIKVMRERMRDLERNNDYVRRYFKLLQNNVLGHCGIGLQMKIRERVKKEGMWVERYDTIANAIVEDQWRAQCRRENFTITGNRSSADTQKLILRSVARDGATLVRKHYPPNHPFKFCIEPIEIDRLDIDFNQSHADGSMTKLGVRYAGQGQVLGYWILQSHPGELYQMRGNGKWTEFVPAERIIHLYDPERIGQTTGVPWLASCMVRLKNLAAYEEAAVINARTSAAKMGFLVPNETANGGYGGPEDDRGNKFMDVEPGSIEMLPRGYSFEKFDPAYPSAEFAPFTKATLRGISAGAGVSYVSLANDLESVNYSSIRAGLLEEREEWKTIQTWFVEWFMRPVFEEWLAMAAIAGALKNSEGGPTLPASKLAKWNQPEFKPRRWDWVDPLKDLQASVLAVEKGFKSRREIISEGGGDIEDTFADIQADEDLAELHDLDFTPESSEQANAQQSKPDAPDDVSPEDEMEKAEAAIEKRHAELIQEVRKTAKPAPAPVINIAHPAISVDVHIPAAGGKRSVTFTKDANGDLSGAVQEIT